MRIAMVRFGAGRNGAIGHKQLMKQMPGTPAICMPGKVNNSNAFDAPD
jgi:hypothetical protein